MRPRARGAPAAWVAAALALAVLGAAIRWNIWTAAASDASGYISQAQLWASGRLTVPVPLATGAPWPHAEWTLSPLGYRPALTPATLVPTYPAGLPLLLAGAHLLGGPDIVHLVVPLLAALGVWATFLLGRHFGGDGTGAVAAALLASSPIWLRQSTQTMSDVPAATCWTLALVLALRGTTHGSLAAGLTAALAIAIRPNLAPLVLAVGAAAMSRGSERSEKGETREAAESGAWRRRTRQLAIFGAGVAPGAVFVAGLHTYLYGSPLRSGYGSNADLYALSNVVENARLYATWLVEGQTPMILLALGSLSARPLQRAPHARPNWILWLTIALTVALYLPYAVFEAWWYIRFLLPAFPAALVLTALAIQRGAALLPASLRASAVLVVTITLVGVSLLRGQALHVLDLAPDERRYALAAEAVSRVTPNGSAFVSLQHSGSLSYYLHRPIVRWELIEPRQLDAALGYLSSRGAKPYLLLDASEAALFRERFGEVSSAGRLDWPPRLELRTPTPVRLYDPADRPRYYAGEQVPTELVFPPQR